MCGALISGRGADLRPKGLYVYKGAHKKVIDKLRLRHLSDGVGKRDNGYSVKAEYPLFFYRHEKQWIYSQLSGIMFSNQSYPIHSEIFSKNLKKV